MSDDDKNGAYNANEGVTLPEGNNATHNAALPPLFFTRSGRGNYIIQTDLMIMWRGKFSILWSANSQSTMNAYWLEVISDAIHPSGINIITLPYSIRCLVSTTNS